MRKDVFGRTWECACGKTHQIDPREIVYAQDALSQLPSILARASDGRRVAVLMDQRTRQAAGEAIARELPRQGWQVTQVLIPDPAPGRSPICDDLTKETLERKIPEVDLFLPVGGGVLSDLGKWLAGDRGRPFVCFATAASMNGYTSANVAPTLNGIKSLVRGRPPVAVASSPEVLAKAPYELTASGLGDILAKSVSSVDWYLNHLLFGDYYCAASVDLIADIEPLYLERSQDLLARRPEAIETLFQALLLTGAAMTMAETSAPSSGGEHLISHCLDMMSSLDGVPHDLHGRQVGVGTILMAELYRRVLELESPGFQEPCTTVDVTFWGRFAGPVEERYAEKIERLETARDQLSQGNAWDDLRGELKPMLRPPEQIQSCLKNAGAAWRAEHLGCNRERLLAAFHHAHEIRSRFTILDLARLTGVLPAAVEEIIHGWA